MKSLAERLDEHSIPEPNSGCILWLGAVDKEGYGQTRDGYDCLKAHRMSYELRHGAIAPGFVLDHKCRVTCCINPDHLEPVTTKENVRRGLSGVMKTHCVSGHPLSGGNLYQWRGRRICRACRAIRWLKTPARRRRVVEKIAHGVAAN